MNRYFFYSIIFAIGLIQFAFAIDNGEFRNIIPGVWVINDYLESIPKTKSPFESSDQLGTYSELIINDISKDSIFVRVSYGNHSGDLFLMFNTKRKYGYRFDVYNNSDPNIITDIYCEIKKDTTTQLIEYNKYTNRVVKKTSYKRILQSTKSDYTINGIVYYVNTVLFKGDYICINNNNSIVSFLADGVVKGLGDFKRYLVNTDFAVRIENNIDNICFYKESDSCYNHAYEIKNDLLKIYSIKINNDSATIRKDTLVYLLKKLK